MKPLLIVKINVNISLETQKALAETVAEGVKQGALVLGPECEIIAFDEAGRLTYSTPAEVKF